ncbi:hypothetical protein [Nocardiopsis algeriensis]|uniref:hypothetical protein n=1 Tax=Nocardiopsis algeriensis TaxID=1478215 RepID=UPI001610BF1A
MPTSPDPLARITPVSTAGPVERARAGLVPLVRPSARPCADLHPDIDDPTTIQE